MATAAIIALSALLVVLRSAVLVWLPWGTPLPETGLVLVLYVALRRRLAAGALATFLIGHLTDLHSGAPLGLHAFSFLIVFMVFSYLRERLFVESGLVEALLSGAAVLLAGLAGYAVRAVLSSSPAGGVPGFSWGLTAFTAAATGLVAPPLFAICRRADAVIGPVPARRGLA